MLYYGDYFNIPEGVVVFNITSMREDLYKLHYLIPTSFEVKIDSRDFDIQYMNYIMGNDVVFFEFFQIIYNLYIGNDVYLAMTTDIDWSENLMESLLKLIQQRYGYNAYRINSPKDYIESLNHTCNFNMEYGLANLDIDKMRYTNIAQERMKFNSNYRPIGMPNIPVDDDDTPPWN